MDLVPAALARAPAGARLQRVRALGGHVGQGRYGERVRERGKREREPGRGERGGWEGGREQREQGGGGRGLRGKGEATGHPQHSAFNPQRLICGVCVCVCVCLCVCVCWLSARGSSGKRVAALTDELDLAGIAACDAYIMSTSSFS